MLVKAVTYKHNGLASKKADEIDWERYLENHALQAPLPSFRGGMEDEMPSYEATATRAAMLRRAVMVSGARKLPADAESRAIDRMQARLGACFTYQAPQMQRATQAAGWRRDFSQTTDQPLQDFDPWL